MSMGMSTVCREIITNVCHSYMFIETMRHVRMSTDYYSCRVSIRYDVKSLFHNADIVMFRRNDWQDNISEKRAR
jgi:hypothetical protein